MCVCVWGGIRLPGTLRDKQGCQASGFGTLDVAFNRQIDASVKVFSTYYLGMLIISQHASTSTA